MTSLMTSPMTSPMASLMASGCLPHQVLLRMERPDLLGLSDLPFEDVMARIDERRSGHVAAPSRARPSVGGELVLVFETAAPVSHLYAVELPAVPALAAFAASEARATDWVATDADASGAVHRVLSARGLAKFGGGAVLWKEEETKARGLAKFGGGAVLWKEEETKAFIGEAGSMTCAHVDIAPQLEVAHGLADDL